MDVNNFARKKEAGKIEKIQIDERKVMILSNRASVGSPRGHALMKEYPEAFRMWASPPSFL